MSYPPWQDAAHEKYEDEEQILRPQTVVAADRPGRLDPSHYPMRMTQYAQYAEVRPEVLACFGGARIMKYPNGALEIEGGTEQEKTQAHDWMKQFLQQGPLTLRRLH
jgi:hypothetical protein